MKGFNGWVSRLDRCRREVLHHRDEGGRCLRRPLPGAGRRQPGRVGGGCALGPPRGHKPLFGGRGRPAARLRLRAARDLRRG